MPIQQSPPGAIVQIDGREYLYFVGTGYLGLQGHADVIQAVCSAAAQYGSGSANSRTAFGTTAPLLDVERRAAEFFGADDAFYFASGWLGNLVLAHLFATEKTAGPGPLVLVDECAHYSLHEAARLLGGAPLVFHHCDTDDLRAKIRAHLRPGQLVLALTDGVFAATGALPPLNDYYALLQEYPQAVLWVDDAHGIAVLGPNGRGAFEHFGLWDKGVNTAGAAAEGPHLLLSGTFSKAVGGFGGILPGGREFMTRLKHCAPHFAGASAPPAPIAAATAKALELVMARPELRVQLAANARLLRDGLREMGLSVPETPAPIVCLTLGDSANMQRIQQTLMDRGIAVAYMAAYSGLGPEGALRLAVFATHTTAMIQRLLDELQTLL